MVISMREALDGATKATAISDAMRAGLKTATLTLAVPLAALFVMAVLIAMAQTRGLVTAEPLRLDTRRIVPSLDRLLGRERALEVGKGIFGLVILGAVAWCSILPVTSEMASIGGASATQILHAVGVLGQRLGIRLAVAMLALGIVDYLWQRQRHRKALRMSRDEVKREHRESEGEPAHKAERLRLHRELMPEQSIGDVKGADFVVFHAGVMAAAIRYDGESAPVVMVKGERRCAQSIEEAARAAGVPVFVEPALVRALARAEEGNEIPERFFEQVAELLVKSHALRRC